MEYRVEYRCPNEMFDVDGVNRELIERQAVEAFARTAPIEAIRKLFHITIDSVKEGVIVKAWL